MNGHDYHNYYWYITIVIGTYSVKCCDVETLGDPLRGPWVTYMDSLKKYKNNGIVLDFQKDTNM